MFFVQAGLVVFLVRAVLVTGSARQAAPVVEAACKAAGKGVDAWANVKHGQMERHLETLVKKKPTKTKCDPIKSVCTYDDDDEQ